MSDVQDRLQSHFKFLNNRANIKIILLCQLERTLLVFPLNTLTFCLIFIDFQAVFLLRYILIIIIKD